MGRSGPSWTIASGDNDVYASRRGHPASSIDLLRTSCLFISILCYFAFWFFNIHIRFHPQVCTGNLAHFAARIDQKDNYSARYELRDRVPTELRPQLASSSQSVEAAPNCQTESSYPSRYCDCLPLVSCYLNRIMAFSRSPTFLSPFRGRPTRFHGPRRNLSSPSPSPASSSSNDSRSRLRRFNDRLPRWLRTYTTPLLGAPVTHITSFLILHEITAIVPLFGLVSIFHNWDWMPDLTSKTGEKTAFDEGVARYVRWFRRRGWIEDSDVTSVAEHEVTSPDDLKKEHSRGVQLVLEFATAYAITKALLPVRLAGSVWATPWFARRILTPVTSIVKVFSRRS